MTTPINPAHISASQLQSLQRIVNTGIQEQNAKSAPEAGEVDNTAVADFELNQTTAARFGDLLGQVDGSEESLSELATMFASTPKELVAIANASISGDFSEFAVAQDFKQALPMVRSLAALPEANIAEDEIVPLAATMAMARSAPAEVRGAPAYPQLTTDISSLTADQKENLLALMNGSLPLQNYVMAQGYESNWTGSWDRNYVVYDLNKLSKDTGLSTDFLKNVITGTRDGTGNDVDASKYGASGTGFMAYISHTGSNNQGYIDTIKNKIAEALMGKVSGIDGLQAGLTSRSYGIDFERAAAATEGEWSLSDMNVADMLVFVNMLRMRMQENQIKDQVVGLKTNVAKAEELGKLKAAISALRITIKSEDATVNLTLTKAQEAMLKEYGIDYKAGMAAGSVTTDAATGDVKLSFNQGKDKAAEAAKTWCDSITQENQTRIDSLNSTQQIQMISLQKWNSTRNESGETASNFLSKFQQLNSQIISKIGQ